MNILLLFPPYPYRGRYVHRAFPLGLGYLAAVLSEHGFQTEIADLSCQTPDDGEIRSLIRSRQPDVIGISAVTENYREAMGLARLARETVPSARIVMGGVHATFRYEELLQRCPEIDFVVVGEGERTMLDLAQAISQGSPLSHIRGIDGLAFRQGDGIVRTAPRQRIDDLDALPYPAFDLLIHPRLDDYYQGETGTLPIISSRGCPFACAFCSTSAMHGKKYRVRSPKQVVDEIERDVRQYGVRSVGFSDDIFTLDQERTKEICLEIIARGLEVTWGCETRVDCVNPGLLRLMKQAGCKGIFYGIESLSDAALARVKKGFTYQQVRQAVAWTLEAGLTVDASFILGLPGETRESLRLIPEFIRETGLKDRIIINVLQILPGVEMCHQPERFGLTVPADDSSHWSDMRSYVEGIGTRDLLETAIEMRLAFHRNKYGDGLLFEVPVPEVEIMDEHLLT